MSKKVWLMKSEPDVFSFDDLKKCKNSTEPWDGVRNYQARNFMRDEMKKGDYVLFYHSNCKVPGIVGLAKVAKEAYPDHTSWDPKSKYFDEKSSPDNPRWFMVEVKWYKAFKEVVSLNDMKDNPALSNMLVVKKGQRLSVQPVEESDFKIVCQMGGVKP